MHKVSILRGRPRSKTKHQIPRLGMEIDGASDYGSDFSPDQEALLEELLLRLPDVHGLTGSSVDDSINQGNVGLQSGLVPQNGLHEELSAALGRFMLQPTVLEGRSASIQNRDGLDSDENGMYFDGLVDGADC